VFFPAGKREKSWWELRERAASRQSAGWHALKQRAEKVS
jgi:hypothetical protein